MNTDSEYKNGAVRLLILADDLTGALDTGVMLASRAAGPQNDGSPAGSGPDVIVTCDPKHPLAGAPDLPDVLVIDTETRHLAALETYPVIFEIVERAVHAGVPHVYIKTDSAMRGNIGAEFRAALDASGCPSLSFVPAFPQMNRTIRAGKVYIDGVLLTDSFYAADPLNKVRSADAAEIIREQCPYHVKKRNLFGQLNAVPDPTLSEPVIELWDTEDTEDLEAIRNSLLTEGKINLMAGCAGFGSQLQYLPVLNASSSAAPVAGNLQKTEKQTLSKPEKQALRKPEQQKLSLTSAPPLLVLCGSVGRATREQTLFAADKGFEICSLTPEEKYCPDYWLQTEGRAKLRRVLEKCFTSNIVLGSFAITDTDKGYCEEHDLSREASAALTSESIARILSVLLEEGLKDRNVHILITGGDTLKSCLDTLGVRQIRPLYELMPGIVVSSVLISGKERRIISKSGGFGDADLFVRLSHLEEL